MPDGHGILRGRRVNHPRHWLEAHRMTDRCFFEGWPGAGPCDGRLIRAHIVPRSLLKSSFYYGVVLEDGAWRKLGRTEDRYDLEHRSLQDLVDDERSWVPCCGGMVGLAGHHGLSRIAWLCRAKRSRRVLRSSLLSLACRGIWSVVSVRSMSGGRPSAL